MYNVRNVELNIEYIYKSLDVCYIDITNNHRLTFKYGTSIDIALA